MPTPVPADLPPALQIYNLVFGDVTANLVFAAARLGIADMLADGPKSCEELARLTGTDGPSLARALRTLACMGVFEETEPQTLRQSPMSEFLRSGVPGSWRNLCIAKSEPGYLRAFAEIEYSLRTGKPALEQVTGKSFFENFSDGYYGAAFHAAMTDWSATESPAVTAAYDFSAIRNLCDVGGGHGDLLGTILEHNPDLSGTLFDAPAVIETARSSPAKQVLLSRCQFIAGNFLESVPAGPDAYIMKHILHDWDDERSQRLLANVRKAVPSSGKLLVVDAVIPPGNEYSPSKLLDMVMLVALGGLERSEQQFRDLFASAGFQLARVIPTDSPVSILEGIPV